MPHRRTAYSRNLPCGQARMAPTIRDGRWSLLVAAVACYFTFTVIFPDDAVKFASPR